jgi:hypothetical protein
LRAGHFAALADGVGDFTGFAQANPDAAAFISDDNEGAEIKAAATFDHFGGAVDENDLFDEFVTGRIGLLLAGSATARAKTSAALVTVTATGPVAAGRAVTPRRSFAAGWLFGSSGGNFARGVFWFDWVRHSIRFH